MNIKMKRTEYILGFAIEYAVSALNNIDRDKPGKAQDDLRYLISCLRDEWSVVLQVKSPEEYENYQ